MGNGAAKRALQAGPLRIGVNPVVIPRQLGKRVDQGLVHQHAIAPVTELLTDQCLQTFGIIHGNLPRV
ncbi:hypothetical protein D3C74_468880 [compost metagenome]